jgi:hypothetical protein
MRRVKLWLARLWRRTLPARTRADIWAVSQEIRLLERRAAAETDARAAARLIDRLASCRRLNAAGRAVLRAMGRGGWM